MKKTTKETANKKKVKDESHVVRYLLLAYLGGVLMFTVAAVPCFAAADPIAVVNNLSTFIFSLIKSNRTNTPGFWHSAGRAVTQIPRPVPESQWLHDPGRRSHYHLCQGDTESYCGRLRKTAAGAAGYIERLYWYHLLVLRVRG